MSGSVVCTLCRNGKYSTVVSVTTRDTCVCCDTNQSMTTLVVPYGTPFYSDKPYPEDVFPTEGAGSEGDCVCGPGTYKVGGMFGGPWTLCPRGKYKSKFVINYNPFGDHCLDCPVGTYMSDEDTSVCWRCDQYVSADCNTCLTGRTDWMDFKPVQCQKGWTGPDGFLGPCTSCVSDKYKATVVSADCRLSDRQVLRRYRVRLD